MPVVNGFRDRWQQHRFLEKSIQWIHQRYMQSLHQIPIVQRSKPVLTYTRVIEYQLSLLPKRPLNSRLPRRALLDGIIVSTARRHESIFSRVLSTITMPRRGGYQVKTSDESAQANDNAMLAQIIEKLSTRNEALEARSRPSTTILPTAPISASFATFEPCKSHAMHREIVAVVGLSHCHGYAEQ